MHEELQDQGFEVITVACDTRGREAVEPFIIDAKPSHPALLDEHHLLTELYNTRNVPAAFWIDEDGRVVRANDPVYAQRRNRETGETTINERYLDALRDWVRNGPSSIYVMSPEQTAAHIGSVDPENAQAMAHFRLGVYLEEQGHHEAAVRQFKRAHELKPDNWNYKREAWTLGDIEEDYGTNFRDAVAGAGIPFYPPLELPEPQG